MILGLMTLLIVICFAFGYFVADNQIINKMMINSLDNKINSNVIDDLFNVNCSGDLLTSSNCLQNQIRSIYKYNISNVGKNLSFSELVASGGVCQHYAELYSSMAKKLGFYSINPIMQVYVNKNNSPVRHEIAIISDYEGFCVFSNDNVVGCQKLEVNFSDIKNMSDYNYSD